MARKIKKPKPPPLAIWDKAIYGVLILGCFALIVLLMELFDRLQVQAIAARSDPRTCLSAPTRLLFEIFPVLSPLMLGSLLMEWMPMPIFGKPGIAYGRYPYHDYAPLLSRTQPLRRAKPQIWADKTRRSRQLLGGMALMLLLGLPGVCPRNTLDQDLSIRHYNMLNVCTRETTPEDIEQVIFTAAHGYSRYGGEYWEYHIRAQTEGGRKIVFREFVLPNGEEAALRCLVEWRHAAEQSGAEITFKARDRSTHLSVRELLPLIARDQRMSAEETALLYELFDGA